MKKTEALEELGNSSVGKNPTFEISHESDQGFKIYLSSLFQQMVIKQQVLDMVIFFLLSFAGA